MWSHDGAQSIKEKLLQELLEQEKKKGEHASGENCTEAASGKETSELSDPPATKKKRLCDLLQNRRTQLTSHQHSFQKECRQMRS